MGGCTPCGSLVTWRMLLPSASAMNRSPPLLRVEMNAIRRPSGDHRGVFSDLSPPIRRRGGAEPSAGTTQMSALRLPLATSVVVRTKATSLPSGESCGSDTRIAPIRSWIVIGRAAAAGAASSRSVATHQRPRKIHFMPPFYAVALLGAQRDERIDRHRAPRGDVARQQRDDGQEDRHADEAEGIGRT